jgi:RNA polymerase sigma factor (sigma-70 family)
MEIADRLTEKAQRDYQLVIRAREHGDQKAYAELLNNYRDSLYFMMLKMTSNATDAEDLTIEAFGKAFKNLAQYTPDFAFSTWLFKIGANNCIDFLRKSKRIQFAEGTYDDENGVFDSTANIPATTLDPEETIIEKQKIELTELDLPLGTVKAQLFRARDFLYQVLRNAEEKI